MISKRAKQVGLKELEIFDNFYVDQNLPKYRKEDKSKNSYESDQKDVDDSMPTLAVGGNNAWVNVPSQSITTGIYFDGQHFIPDHRIPLKEKFIKWLLKNLQKSKSTQEQKPEKPVKVMTIVEFFTNLSKSYEELTPIGEIAEHYESAVVEANVMGQKVLLEKLKDLMEVVRGEAHLITMALSRYVTEKQVIDFYEKVGEDKNLKLTWIQHFNRIIPEDVYVTKKNVDDRKIFDNYVVLHYDPKDNGEGLTKAEIEKKKDPILFGLIKNSRKLYYVADWKDEYCDLTLEEMFKTLGEKVLKINNKSVKTFIDKIKI
jgi:hypothetical protein